MPKHESSSALVPDENAAPASDPALRHHFDDLAQQHEAATLGMWLFLATEVMFFGGLFSAYMIYRVWYPGTWGDASRTLDITLGTVNTIVLITSSLTMALAVHAAATNERRKVMSFLVVTMVLGVAFLGIKSFEYYQKFAEHHVPGLDFRFEGQAPERANLFFSLYFAMTGLHALHMIIGLGILSVILYMAWRGRFTEAWHTPVEISGLYWHFVDIIWIFLFPLLYLVDRHR
ncbi:MAG TPA: cytochrome c oxidase subunit 3 family protein [Vicinamibacterales bacterium]